LARKAKEGVMDPIPIIQQLVTTLMQLNNNQLNMQLSNVMLATESSVQFNILLSVIT
jgi:hypothetical protein